MTRLPTPGGDMNSWGNVLNNFLKVAHTSSGGLTSSAVSSAGAEMTSNKGTASGYAALSSSGTIPVDQLGTGTADNSNFLRGDSIWTAIPGSNTLDGDSDVALTSPTNDQVLSYNGANSVWQNADQPVTSVAGRTGTVTLGESDVANLGVSLSGKLTAGNNLSDLASVSSARSKLGLGTAATLNVDTTDTDIQSPGTKIAGSTGKLADAGHVHPLPRLDQAGAPTATISMNSHKLTNLAVGTAAADIAQLGQVPLADTTAADITILGTTTAAGSTGKWADAGHAHADPNPQPEDMGIVAWTSDPGIFGNANGTGKLSTGVVYLNAFWIRQSATLSTVWVQVQTAGIGLTAGQCFAGIYDVNGSLIAVTADQSAAWSSVGLVQMNLTSAVNVSPGKYFISLIVNGTTGPAFLGTANGQKLVNANLSGAGIRTSTNGTGFSSLPNPLTMANNDPNGGTNTGLLGALLA